MEDSRLNINRPLLSVRRFSSTSASQKNENRENENFFPVRPHIESCRTESTSDPIVPFGWEHSPGRPKNRQTQAKENTPSLPKLPPGRFLRPIKKDLGNNSQDSNVTKITRLERTKSRRKESSGSRDDDDDDDDDEAFMDALDTLSRGETSFYNCSASGVSGHGSDGKPVKADPKMRDFMMGRFLPAAKAMASDVPKHNFKKNVNKEKPREVKKLVNTDNHNTLQQLQQLRYGPNFLQDVGHVQDVGHDKEEAEEDYDSDYDYYEHANSSSKFCGLFPSFCSVNPVHGMCTRNRLPPMSPANRTHASSSSSSSFRETENEPARNGVYKHRSLNSALKINSNGNTNIEGSTLYNRLQGRGISINLNKSCQSTVSTRSDSSSKKKGISFKDLLAGKNTNQTETDGQDSITEKTLYVVDVHVVRSPKEKSLPPSTRPQTDTSGVSSKSCDLKQDFKSISDFSCDSKHDLKTKQHKGVWGDSEVNFDEFKDTKGEKNVKASEKKCSEQPAPPPLPKTPSDSWLSRALPSVSSRSAPLRWNPRYPSSNTFADDQKSDENIQLRCSPGQLNTIPEN